MVETSRRILLTGWVALVLESRAYIRLVIGVLTSISTLLLTVLVRPYRHMEDQMLAVAAHCQPPRWWSCAIGAPLCEGCICRLPPRPAWITGRSQEPWVVGLESTDASRRSMISICRCPLLCGTVAAASS